MSQKLESLHLLVQHVHQIQQLQYHHHTKLHIQQLAKLSGSSLGLTRFLARRSVSISAELINVLSTLRTDLAKSSNTHSVSDRRIVKAMNMLKIVSYSTGSPFVGIFDSIRLKEALWTTEEDIPIIIKKLHNKMIASEEADNLEIILNRLFVRCCKHITHSSTEHEIENDLDLLLHEISTSLSMLDTRLNFIEDSATIIWLANEEILANYLTLIKLLKKTKICLTTFTFELLIMKALVFDDIDLSVCAELMSDRWSNLLKSPLKC